MPHQCTNCGHTFPDGSKEMLSGCPDCGGNKFQFAPTANIGDTKPAPSSPSADDDTSASAVESDSPSDNAVDHDSDGETAGPTARAAKTVRKWVSGSDSDASSDASVDSSSPSDADSFSEWPDTAKRPDDRSTDGTHTEASSSSVSAQSSVDRSPSRSGDTSTHSPALDETDSIHSSTPAEEDSAQASARSDIVSPDELPSAGESPQPENGQVVSEPDEEEPSLEDLRTELNEQFESIKIVSPGQYELNLMELYDREEHIVSLQEDGRYVINVPDSWREGDAEH